MLRPAVMANGSPRVCRVCGGGDELLTVCEVAAVLKVSPKRIRNMMSAGAFKDSVHFTHVPGIGPRFRRRFLNAWLATDIPKRRGFIANRHR